LSWNHNAPPIGGRVYFSYTWIFIGVEFSPTGRALGHDLAEFGQLLFGRPLVHLSHLPPLWEKRKGGNPSKQRRGIL
jgi:hypothetical protein